MAAKSYTLLCDKDQVSDDMTYDPARSASVSVGQRQSVFHWFCAASESDALWILSALQDARPGIFAQLLAQRESSDSLEQDHRGDLASQRSRAAIQTRLENKAFIQFSSPVVYCDEGETSVRLDVMRIGNTDGPSEVAYETVDDSALAGKSYVAVSGVLSFKSGETVQQVEVAIIDNSAWNTTLEFKVVLKNEGLTGAVLARSLSVARVKVVDSSPFPSKKYGKYIVGGDMEHVSKKKLFMEYVKLNLQNPKVRRGTILTILIDACTNLLYLMHLFMYVYLLDQILGVAGHNELIFVQDRSQSLLLYAGICIAAMAISHLLAYCRLHSHIGGTSRIFLQQALVRKFLNYDAEVRHRTHAGIVITAITRDVTAIVDEGYHSCIECLQALGHFSCMVLFNLVSPKVFGKQFDPVDSLPMVVFPVVFTLYLLLRESAVRAALDLKNQKNNDVIGQLTVMTHNVNMVLDYSLRTVVTDQFKHVLKEFNHARRAARVTLLNTMYFSKWVAAVAVVCYIYYGALQIIGGHLSIGIFVANIKTFEATGVAFEGIFSSIVAVQSIFPSLENIVKLINAPTETKDRMMLTRSVAKRTAALRIHHHNTQLFGEEQGQAAIAGIDAMPIVLSHSKDFQLKTVGQLSKLNFKGVIEMSQGLLFAFVGGIGCGKATLLRTIASRCSIRDGGEEVFVPAHLRIVNVSDEPMFYAGTLFENLTLGARREKEVPRDRVLKICRDLGISENVLSYLDSEKLWSELLSGAQCKLLMIARALVTNPELICFHKPLERFDEGHRPIIMNALLGHVHQKGLHTGRDPRFRRPRTVFISAVHAESVKMAQEIYSLSLRGGITRLGQKQVMDS